MKSTITERKYKAIYRLLDRVSPVDYDCGELCGAACCTCTYSPDGFDDGEYLGLYLLPGEEKVHRNREENEWIRWDYMIAEDYEFPESWHGKVYFIQCKTAPACPRRQRPIQCRTFPLSPHIGEDGVFHMIMYAEELPYKCPLLGDEKRSEGREIQLSDRFIRATYTAWKHLLKDPLILDLVEMDSQARIEEGKNLITVI